MNRVVLILLLLCLVLNDVYSIKRRRRRPRPSRRFVVVRPRRVCQDKVSNCLYQLSKRADPRIDKFCEAPHAKKNCQFFCGKCPSVGRSVTPVIRVPIPSKTCQDLFPAFCPIVANRGLCDHLKYKSALKIFCEKSCPSRQCHKACITEEVGMQNGAIQSSMITASSAYPESGFEAFNGRLNNGYAWSPLMCSPRSTIFQHWFQVDLGKKTIITDILTQGSPRYYNWVTYYQIGCSDNGIIFPPYIENGKRKIFIGNVDWSTVKRNTFLQPIATRFIRFTDMKWHNSIALRVEFYGCKKTAAIAPFKIYSALYKKCLTYDHKLTSIHSGWSKSRSRFLHTSLCTRSNIQKWQWSSYDQLVLQTKDNLCLTLKSAWFGKYTVVMAPCRSHNRYQQWTCFGTRAGDWNLKWKHGSVYIVPKHGANAGIVAQRQRPTGSCKWYKYVTRLSKQSLCSTVVTTKPKPRPPPGNRLITCGTKAGLVGHVVNGKVSKTASWPWYVGIKYCPNCNITCGGTLINDQWVVTAAHCVNDYWPSDLFLEIGEIDQSVKSGNEQSFKCLNFTVHEKFDIHAAFDYDIALIRLDKYAVFNDHVRPLCLPTSGKVLTSNDPCKVTGFGKTTQNGVKSAKLREATVGIIPHHKCRTEYLKGPDPKNVTDTMLCAAFDLKHLLQTDACQGDSGGPLTCFDSSTKKFNLGGIVSWGVGCAVPLKYGVYTDTATLVNWVKQELAKW